MSTSTVSAPTPERVTPPQKPSAAKTSTTTTAALPGQFAALLLQADETLDTDAVSITPKTAGKEGDATETADGAPARTLAEDDPLPGSEAALLGLLTWRNYAPAPLPAPGATSGAATALPPQTLSAVNQALVGTTGPTKPLTTDAASADMPTNFLTQPPSASSAVGMAATDAQSQPLTASGLTEGAPTAAQSTKLSPTQPPGAAVGIEAPGSKAKPSAARLALNAIQGASPSTSSTVAPATSTVALASKSAPPEPAGMANRAAVPRAATTLSETGVTARTDTTESESTSPSVALANPVDPSAPPTGAGSDGAGADTGTATMPTTVDAPTTPAHDAMEQTMERLSAQVSYWATQGSQRASLTIADDQAGPIDVSISFEKGEVSVHFETEEDSVREALQSGAEDILNRLLEAKGMTLGSVSIGLGQNDHRQPPQQQSAPTDTDRGGTRLQQATSSTGDTTSAAPRRAPDVISANKLDFFA